MAKKPETSGRWLFPSLMKMAAPSGKRSAPRIQAIGLYSRATVYSSGADDEPGEETLDAENDGARIKTQAMRERRAGT